MNLVVVSHKLCWSSKDSASGYQTDGGFPLQMRAISELFSRTNVVVPCENKESEAGASDLTGHNLQITPLSILKGSGIRRKIGLLGWGIVNAKTIWKAVRQADAVHTPIPGDIGTIGMLFALIQRKPLFVRHCGNWFVQRTLAEKLWKWSMEYFAGGRNLMLATGGAAKPPSERNPNIKWIFSTSLRQDQIANIVAHQLPEDGKLRLIIACRQEERKGTDIVIDSLPLILKTFPQTALDVIGDGSLLKKLKQQAKNLGLEERVTFHGKIAQSKVVALLKQAHLFCYPTSASEGFPKVVLEALAAGLPVVTTKVSVLPQLIISGGGECGILLDEPTPAALADGVIKICSDKNLYEQMSMQANAVAQQYSLENWRDFIGAALESSWKVPIAKLLENN